MTLILHGISLKGEPGPADILAEGCLALCSPLAPEDLRDPERTEAAALAHHSRLVLARRTGDVLPIRFGAVFSGPGAVAAHLAERAGAYRAALARIRGAEEYTLTLTPLRARPMDSAATARAFLRARLARRLAREAGGQREAEALAGVFARLAALSRGMLVLPGREGAARLALLVAEGRLETVLQAARPPHDLFALAVTGPWPAYSFASLEPALA